MNDLSPRFLFSLIILLFVMVVLTIILSANRHADIVEQLQNVTERLNEFEQVEPIEPPIFTVETSRFSGKQHYITGQIQGSYDGKYWFTLYNGNDSLKNAIIVGNTDQELAYWYGQRGYKVIVAPPYLRRKGN